MEKNKYFANKGLKRNKKPLKNIIYKFESPLYNEAIYYCYWKYQSINMIWISKGVMTEDEIKEIIGEKQWSKFCQGKREFIIQRRINNKNI